MTADTRACAGRSGPVLALFVNALIWGLSWWPLRWLEAHGVHALWATCLVYLIPALSLLALRARQLRPVLANRGLWALAAAAGVTNAAFNWGVLVGEVVRVVLLFYLMPIWALVFARWLLGERIEANSMLRVALALGGAAIVLWRPQAGLPLPDSMGDWLGLVGGVGFALTNVLLRREAALPAQARMFAMFIGGLTIPGALAIALTLGTLIAPLPPVRADWLLGVLLLCAALVTGNLALTYGAARLAAGVTAVVMLTEVLFATLSAVWLGGESLDARTLAGGALIFAAALLAGISRPGEPAHRPQGVGRA